MDPPDGIILFGFARGYLLSLFPAVNLPVQKVDLFPPVRYPLKNCLVTGQFGREAGFFLEPVEM